MTDDKTITEILEQLQHQQALLYALYHYLSEQPFFDAKKFAEIFEEFDADLVAALKRRPTTRADAALLKRLSKMLGPKH